MLPTNVTATTSVAEAIAGARYAVHALPVQHSRAFLTSIKVRACLAPNCRSTQLGTKGHTLLKLHLHLPPPPHLPRPQANTRFCKQQLHLQCGYLVVQFMLYLAHQHITQSVHVIAYTGWCCVAATNCVLGQLQDILPHDVPIISVSKGLEVGTGKMMSELVVDVLGRKHPCVFMSGPSFAKEVMTLQPTGVVAASKVSL